MDHDHLPPSKNPSLFISTTSSVTRSGLDVGPRVKAINDELAIASSFTNPDLLPPSSTSLLLISTTLSVDRNDRSFRPPDRPLPSHGALLHASGLSSIPYTISCCSHTVCRYDGVYFFIVSFPHRTPYTSFPLHFPHCILPSPVQLPQSQPAPTTQPGPANKPVPTKHPNHTPPFFCQRTTIPFPSPLARKICMAVKLLSV